MQGQLALPQSESQQPSLVEDFQCQRGAQEVFAAAALQSSLLRQTAQEGQVVGLQLTGAELAVQHAPVGHQLFPGHVETADFLCGQRLALQQALQQRQILCLMAAGG